MSICLIYIDWQNDLQPKWNFKNDLKIKIMTLHDFNYKINTIKLHYPSHERMKALFSHLFFLFYFPYQTFALPTSCATRIAKVKVKKHLSVCGNASPEQAVTIIFTPRITCYKVVDISCYLFRVFPIQHLPNILKPQAGPELWWKCRKIKLHYVIYRNNLCRSTTIFFLVIEK